MDNRGFGRVPRLVEDRGELNTSTTITSKVFAGTNPTGFVPFTELTIGDNNCNIVAQSPPDPAASTFTLQNAGVYHFFIDFSFIIVAGGGDRTFDVVIFVNGFPAAIAQQFVISGTSTTAITFTGLASLPAGAVIDFRIQKTAGTAVTLDINRANMALFQSRLEVI